MMAQGFEPLSDEVLSDLSVGSNRGLLQGFQAFEEVVKNLQLWVEGNYAGLTVDKEFSTKKLPHKGEVLADEGNLAWAWAHIGAETKDWFSYSTNSKLPKSKKTQKYLTGIVGSVKVEKKKEANFDWLKGGTITVNHTEPKLLVVVQDGFDLDPDESNGYVIIVSSRDVCSSCKTIIHNFAKTFPHLIIYGVGLGQIGQGQKNVEPERQISGRMRSGSISNDLPAIKQQSKAHKPLQILCFHGNSISGGVFTPKGIF
jgi:hypothetical protein